MGDVGNAVLRDRQHLAEDGIVIVAIALDAEGSLTAGPEITSRGFVFIKEADVLMNEAEAVVVNELERCLKSGTKDHSVFRTSMKDALSDFFWKKTKRRPMILPMILN